MIQANEVRIGNWYIDPNRYASQVDCECFTWEDETGCYFNQCDPIPLTPDVLVACGFVAVVSDWFKRNEKYISEVEDGLWHFIGCPYDIKFQHLHQLQNFYTLMGEELIYTPNGNTPTDQVPADHD